jgi:hypothetical protein
MPHLQCVYRGPVKPVTLKTAQRVAGVRVLQQGKPKEGFLLGLSLVPPVGEPFPLQPGAIGANWGAWLLYPIVPNRSPVLTTTIQINEDPSLSQMEVWAVKS